MGQPHQDPSVPAATVEFPPELLVREQAAPSPKLAELRSQENRKIGRDDAPESGLGGALGATVFVLAILAGAFLLLRKLLGRSRLFAPGSAMRVLARRPLAPKQEVILVEIGPRVLVIGATRESLSRLGEVTSAEEIAALRSRCGIEPAPAVRPARPAPAPEAPSYDGVVEELTRIRSTVRDWSRQEVAP
jgi:flagellar biosynthetic protein FliO